MSTESDERSRINKNLLAIVWDWIQFFHSVGCSGIHTLIHFWHNGVLEKQVYVELYLENVVTEQIGVSSKVSGSRCPAANSIGPPATRLTFIFTCTKILWHFHISENFFNANLSKGLKCNVHIYVKKGWEKLSESLHCWAQELIL